MGGHTNQGGLLRADTFGINEIVVDTVNKTTRKANCKFKSNNLDNLKKFRRGK